MIAVIARKTFFSCSVSRAGPEQDLIGVNCDLEAFVSGPIDPVSGLVMNLFDLDQILKEIVEPLDHKHLDLDLKFWQTESFTPQGLCQRLHSQIGDKLKSHNENLVLVKLRLNWGRDLQIEAKNS